MHNINGLAFTYQEDYNNQIQRIVVPTITQQELLNLKNFSDVIEIDSTIVPLQLDWQIIPITLIDQYKNIC
jgi:hypothetical protein